MTAGAYIKWGFISLLCLSESLPASGRQLHTIKSGNWEADSVWYNQMHPGSTDDTILVSHHLLLHSNIILGSNDYLLIDTTGWLCGNDTLYTDDNSFLVNYGFLGLYHWETEDASIAYNIFPGIMDFGDGGVLMKGYYFADSGGCLVVHPGPENCCISDTTINVITNDSAHLATITTGSGSVAYYYFFGDSSGIFTGDPSQMHFYEDTGKYYIELLAQICCVWDTLFDSLDISIPLAPAPPVCIDSFSFISGPNPADESFVITRQFCTDENGAINVYALTGQIVYSRNFSTTSQKMQETVPTLTLAPAPYILEVRTNTVELRKKIVVIHIN